jgi:hypothetical protein
MFKSPTMTEIAGTDNIISQTAYRKLCLRYQRRGTLYQDIRLLAKFGKKSKFEKSRQLILAALAGNLNAKG